MTEAELIANGWINIYDKSQNMPVRQDFYVLFDNGEILRHYQKHPPKALATHWKPMPDQKPKIKRNEQSL